MAQLHGKAGQWAKNQAERRFFWFLLIALIFLYVLGIGMGLFLGLGLTRWGLLVLAITVVVTWLAPRLIYKPIDGLLKERIKYLRGGQVEALVAWLLMELDDTWHIFNSVKLEEDWDIDHVVVGPGGVFVLSTKDYRGLFHLAGDGRVFYNNKPTGLIGNTLGQAMQLRDKLVALLGDDVPYVTAVLAVPLAYVEFPGPQRNVWVLHQENLTDTLEGAGKRLNKEQIARCVKAVAMLVESSRAIYQPPARTPEPAATAAADSSPKD